MQSFLVSARKYRPLDFKDVVGQQAITTTLTNAITNDHLPQAMLFCGPHGVGKTTCARILAKKINEDAGRITGEDYAFNIFELDAASNNSVDDIRMLIDQVRVPPRIGVYKVYIIDEMHMLSQAAYNAFLKTLEEPPGHAIFILATTEKHKIIPTVLSRCQIFDFKRITVSDISDHLKYVADSQDVKTEEGALHIIAKKADGALRDALSLFDRVVSFCGDTLKTKDVATHLNIIDEETYLEITADILKGYIPKLLLRYDEILASGFDGRFFVLGLASHFRNLMVCRNTETVDLMDIDNNIKSKYLKQSKDTATDFLIECLNITTECELRYKSTYNQRLLIELCLMKLASLSTIPSKKKTEVNILPPPSPTKHYKSSKNSDSTTENTKSGTVPSDKNGISALSISGIKYKKSLERTRNKSLPYDGNAPQEPFTKEDLNKSWDDFKEIYKAENNQRTLSVLNISDIYQKSDDKIGIVLPTESSKDEFSQVRESLLNHLRRDLKNHHLDLELKIDTGKSNKELHAITPEEKYEKLRNKNPEIENLMRRFSLTFD